MEFLLEAGITYTAKQVVTEKDLASSYGSGTVRVFATPSMIALMENAAMHAVQALLPEGFNTVGVAVNIEHSKATPFGMQVQATAVLKKTDGRRLEFEVTAHDETGEIGRGTHARYIIEEAKFLSKLTKNK